MFSRKKHNLTAAGAALFLAAWCHGQALSPEVKAKVEAKAREFQAWGTDPRVVAAVKARNSSPSAEEAAMTNDKWKSLTLLDPFVRSFTKNPVGVYLKEKKDPAVTEAFVSGADGTKVGFLSKTTSWSHKGKEKHEVPMTGKTWIGPLEVDESTGQQQVQVGLPVLEGGKPIGSIVVGLGISKL
jgi:hypothetical protein